MEGSVETAIRGCLGRLPADVTVTWQVRVAGRSVAARDADLVLRTASLGKILLLLAAARAVVEGTANPSELLDRTTSGKVGDSGLWQHLEVERLPLADVALLVGGLSDNLATNVLLDRFGLDAVRACGRDLGLAAVRLLDRVRDARSEDDPPALSVGSAAELATLFERIDRGALPWPGVGELVLEWLSVDADLSMVASAFGLDPLSHRSTDRGLVLRHKTGTDPGVRAEAGILRGPAAAVAYAVLANWRPDGPDRRDAVIDAMRSAGSVIRSVAVVGPDR